jgi:glycosyltransferase involved in cell wall biosynthesis
MLVSIIIPSFQQSQLLEGALKSIWQQTFKDYEVIIVDGGSRDNTALVAASFNQLPIQFYSEPDKGIYDAMNKGIARSSGQYLYFMGCDDRFAADDVLNKIFSNSALLENDVIYGDALFSDSNTRYDGEFTYFKLLKKNICHQAIFTRRKVFDVLGGFDIRYRIYADWEFNMRWFTADWVKRQYLPLVVANYSASGFSSSLQDEVFFSELGALKKKYFPAIINYLVENQDRPLHWRLIRFLTYDRMKVIRRYLGK